MGGGCGFPGCGRLQCPDVVDCAVPRRLPGNMPSKYINAGIHLNFSPFNLILINLNVFASMANAASGNIIRASRVWRT